MFSLHGVDLIYKPAMFIIGGLVAIAALEYRQRDAAKTADLRARVTALRKASGQ